MVEEAAADVPRAELDGLTGLVAFYLPTMQSWWQEDEPICSILTTASTSSTRPATSGFWWTAG